MISNVFSELDHNARTNLTAKGDKPATSNATSLPNEATRRSNNKRPFFPITAQDNGKLPRQLPSKYAD
ncbi:hypothetical protein OH458_21515 [Vibrio sp. MarTm2]|uniref:hypothetical protein n=1 Tax=Vibrio sp. MarTm2 TaxID=2998831 RepID=UPI0022CD8744|nr:hypothetical protein [Vibrio sp. MarTm2]MDA0130646.1 hypothetical protein [Vibrio sp. MarTm2]